ncbi:MAG: hypothetical protein ACJ79H_20625 [Myxococcales bacterium]
MGRKIAAVAALLCACGAEFIEPNPPRLLRTRVDYEASSAAEPAVWVVVSDLFLEHDEDCAATVAWLAASIRAAVPASVPGKLELPALQTSPCTQPNSRTIDPAAIDAALRTAESAFPGRAVRAVIVYANNVLLTVPGQIASALEAARRLAVARGALEPRVWALLPATLAGGVRADRTVVWTYAGDPTVARQLSDIAAAELPYTSDAGLVTPPLQVFARGPAGVRVFKICRVDPAVELLGFSGDGTAVSFDAAQPPQYRVALAARFALPRSEFQAQHAGLEVEACLDHCDRYHGDDRVRWLTKQGCVLPGASS